MLPPLKAFLRQMDMAGAKINGQRLQIQEVDSQLTPSQAVLNWNQYSGGALAVVLPSSAELSAIAPLAAAAGIPIVTQATATAAVASGRPYVWDIIRNPVWITNRAVAFWLKALPSAKTGIVDFVDSQNPISVTQSNQAAQFLTSYRKIPTQVIDYPSTVTDYTSYVLKAQAANPGGIIVGGSPAQASALVAAIRAAGMNVPILVNQNGIAGTFLQTAGNVQNVYGWMENFVGPGEPSTMDAPMSLCEHYNSNVHCDTGGVSTYLEFEVLTDALRRAHPEKISSLKAARQAVNTALQSTDLKTIRGDTLKFGSDGFVSGYNGFLAKDVNGSWQVVNHF
jgi:ABC-type branched-subunit amino acid transport system substrate-binding protein